MATNKTALKASIKQLEDADQRKANKDFQKETDKYQKVKKTFDEWTGKFNRLYAQALSNTISAVDQSELANMMNEQDKK